MSHLEPFVGAEVIWETPSLVVEGIISHIDRKSDTVRINRSTGFRVVPINELRYKPTMVNFLKFVEDWDINYKQSDDPIVFDRYLNQEKELREMFQLMHSLDKHLLNKLSYVTSKEN
jgi:hypothetical protein